MSLRCKKCNSEFVDSGNRTEDGRIIYVCPLHENIQALEARDELKMLLSIRRPVLEAQIVINYVEN